MTARSTDHRLSAGGRTARVTLRLEGRRFEARVGEEGEGRALEGEVRRVGEDVLILRIDGRRRRAVVCRAGRDLWVSLDGETWRFEPEGAEGAAASAAAGLHAASPMTGVLAKVSVEPGQEVPAGTELFVVEAMKMEYSVKAPRDVVVASVRHAQGEQVAVGGIVVVFEDDAP